MSERGPRADLREFLRTRRARLTPEQAGIHPMPGARRVPGLRREEVAQLAGVSVDYYVRLERGRSGSVSESVSRGVALALQLDDAERDHLFALADPIGRPPRAVAEQQARLGLVRVFGEHQ
ncbi:helix-turn-helix domain-containing protein [Streptomyces sp. NPDC002573]|uniref:helix-turn-helix domain-containing protein n=1 Tax=Streptomyces sp. NPDC002573 TaxID=3364651 RepID=UPI0036CF3937